MKIAIVNDLAIAQTVLQRVLQTVPNYQIIWTAKNGDEAVRKCAQNKPDIILMDLLMPVMNGVEATRQIMKNSPCFILIVTSDKDRNLSQVYQAMEYGAIDVVNTPVFSSTESDKTAKDLLDKIARIGKLMKVSTTLNNKVKESPSLSPVVTRNKFSATTPLIAIGSSTGGPKALAKILSQLPANFDAAVSIVQHVDAQFSEGFVDWLKQQCALPVRIANSGDRLEKGTVLVAGTNDHLYLQSDLTLSYTQHPINYPYRPSVDVFFKSLAQNWTRKGTAILLTGMGRDGAEGLSALRLQGWHTIAQDKESCVVYGMPKAAVELNAAVEVLSLDAIASTLLKNSLFHRNL
ncbi:chemotaxis response regulator protein-glutamate methylesterase [Aerosakkonemataceae cyanobacterium BLCC-F50]|uniref:Protein-glutamate methylesterase/protein-glutamine glutaminase n=1 Tax=Floridaenema flaviceps BLCC-F50 TaxID=3153642 RepID=A0ABV4Y2J6_9CYAN